MKNYKNSRNFREPENVLNSNDEEINLKYKYQILSFIFSFLLSISNICGETSPFGVAVCASISQEFSLTACLGALLGYFVSMQANITYIIFIFLIIIFRTVFDFGNNKKLFSPAFVCLSFLIFNIIFMIVFDEFSFYNFLINFSKSVMLGGTTFFLTNFQKIFKNPIYYKGLSSDKIATILISLVILLIPLMSVIIYNISLGKILFIYIILFVALNLDSKTSGCVSMILSLAVLLSGHETNGYVILSYGISGFISSLAKKYRSLGIAAIFSIVTGLTYICVSIIDEKNILSKLFELMISCVLFIITSEYFKNRFFLFREKDFDMLSYDNAKNLMTLKLYFASDTLHDIASTTQKLSHKLSKDFLSSVDNIYNQCADKICKTCNLKMFCWNTSYNDIINSFNDMTHILNNNKKIKISDVSNFMKQKCKKLDEIVCFINENYNKFIAQKSINRKVDEIRGVITDQFDGLSIMLKEIAQDFDEISKFDKTTTIKAKKVLSDLGFNVYNITSFWDKYGRLTIEAITNTVKNIDYIDKTICLELSNICDKNFELPAIVRSNQTTKITVIEKAVYQIDFGATQLSCDNLKDCGDAYNYFIDSKGRAFMILSDGMGTGSQAAIDGAMTAGLLSKLIKAGFDFESASKIVNSALLVKPGEESLSTIDVASINLYTGQVDMFKVGAAPSFTKKSDRILEINCSTLPAGILKKISFEKKTISLKNKDIIIMVSDGVTNNEYEWIYDELKYFKYNISAKELSRKIALESKFRNKLYHDDDVTVMVGIISKGA